VDFISTTPLDREAERQILDRLQTTFDSYDAILISDQAETSRGGVVTEAIRDLVADLAPAYPEKVIVADSRVRAAHFRNVILKPNQQEGEAASREIFGRVDWAALRRHTQSPLLLVTHGGDGVLLIDESGEQWVRTRKVKQPVDICGAGDSFAAGLAAALAAKASAVEAVQFGNHVANITIMKRGTGTASPEELLEAYDE
jgi:bifunctional ADP-heptose synthase (sugar kinase/adenylyltransferase)